MPEIVRDVRVVLSSPGGTSTTPVLEATPAYGRVYLTVRGKSFGTIALDSVTLTELQEFLDMCRKVNTEFGNHVGD